MSLDIKYDAKACEWNWPGIKATSHILVVLGYLHCIGVDDDVGVEEMLGTS